MTELAARTIFYWGWWVSWAPFVGMFIGTISRGRTIRQVVFGAFLAPIVYSFFFLGVLGHLGIKMQRVTELSLNQPPLGTGINLIPETGKVNCTAMGYEGSVPSSDEAIALANKGYFNLQCRGHNDRFWDVLMPYGEGIYMFLGIISLIGVVFYFVTSSVRGYVGLVVNMVNAFSAAWSSHIASAGLWIVCRRHPQCGRPS